jgi:hypothetical protein
LWASEQPSEPLSSLFELIRSGTKAPRCELRLVPGLRSPAATGWWRPKVLLPSELLPRLEGQQLVYVLRHELMHVRRRDYLWDRLATLGCYLVFFHPSAWLVRRRLRWERELVCDDCVVDRSGERRLEYASCLTTLASWWYLEEEIAGPVDFLSSPPSLLSARVRALSRETPSCPRYKKTAIGFLAIAALTLGVWLVPEVGFTLSGSLPPDLAKTERLRRFPQPIARINRQRISKRHPLFATVATSTIESRSAAPNLEFPINLPVLSSPPVVQKYQFTEPPIDSGSSGELSAESRATGPIWDESPPAHTTPSRRTSKVATVAAHAIRFGVGLLGLRIGGHEHEKELR